MASALAFVTRSTRRLANQFEHPLLFFTLTVIAIAVPVENSWLAGPGWYCAARRMNTYPDSSDAQPA